MIDTIRTFFDNLTTNPDIPLLLMRWVAGFVFITSSINKSKDIKKFAKSNGLPVPISWGLVFAEFAGGVGFILGIWTQVAALVLMGVMSGSIFFHVFKWGSPYWASEGGWEYDLMLFTMAMVILATGGGDIGLATTF